jgi:beta-lactamase regulating signal transducer with metallopeptidase domain
MDTLMRVGLTNAAAAAVLALLAAAVGRLYRRPAVTHALWLLVLLKLVTPPLCPVPVWWEAPVEQAAHAARGSEDSTPGFITGETAALDPRLGAAEPGADLPGGEVLAEPVDDPRPAGSTPRLAVPASSGGSWETVVGTVWLTGSACWLALTAVHLNRLRRLLHAARPAPDWLQEQVRRLGQRLGLRRCPGVWVLPARVPPLLWALAGTPRLLLPCGLWDRLGEEEMEALLAHELAHLRRRDHWVRRLELLVLALYWWHPAVWWARWELHEAEELCCDAWVVATLPGLAEAYAEALVETVSFLSRARCALPVGASGIGQTRSLLKRRVLMILEGTTPKELSRAGRCAVLGLAAVLLPFWPTAARSQDRQPPPEAVPATEAASPRGEGDREEQIREAEMTVERLRKEVEELQARMRAAERKLREAQGRLDNVWGRNPRPQPKPATTAAPKPDTAPLNRKQPPDAVETPRFGAPGSPAGRPRDPSAATKREFTRRPEGADAPGGDYERRLRAVEQKLDQILEELRLRRDRRPERPSGDTTPAPARR